MINEGDKAPDLTVKASDGSTINLASPGAPLVLYFYPKDDTSGCTKEAQEFTALAGEFAKSGARVVGVSRDPMKKHEKFIDKYDLKVPLASDEDGRISDAFGTWVEKSMYGRKYMGTARSTFIIDEKGVIEEIIEKVDTKNHTDQILKNGGASSTPKKSTTAKSTAKKAAAKKSKSNP